MILISSKIILTFAAIAKVQIAKNIYINVYRTKL